LPDGSASFVEIYECVRHSRGVLTALIAGVIATRNNYRKPTQIE
jgi:hypothetical protein